MAYTFKVFTNMGTYSWSGQKYFVGTTAYEQWIHALERNQVQKFHFSLIMEVLNEARYHASIFLSEMKDNFNGPSKQLMEDANHLYSEICDKCNYMKTRFPYEQPHELLNDTEREQTIAVLKEVLELEKQALSYLKKIHQVLKNAAKPISNRVTEIYVHVSNYDASMEWYSNVLGIQKDIQGRLDMDGTRILLIGSEKRNPTTHACLICFRQTSMQHTSI